MLPVSDAVNAKQKLARADKRAAFVHGNTLPQQSLVEAGKWSAAVKRATELIASDGFDLSKYKNELSTPTGPDFIVNDRCRKWLRYQYRKCTTEDDWSINGDPHEWWDRYTSTPMLNYPRFDCSESSYFFLLIADKTPAWREVYTTCLEGFTRRHCDFWGAVDWNTQFGEDPDWENYLSAWKGTIIPEPFFGNYNTPGWTANGIEHPQGYNKSVVQGDPLNANGMLFFKGWLSLLMGIRERVGGDAKWTQFFQMTGVDGQKFAWNYDRMVQTLSKMFLMNNGKGLN